MDATLGTELPQRGVYVWGGLAVALVMLLPTVRAFRRAAGEQDQVALAWTVSTVMALVLVVVPALTAWVFARKHVFVSEHALTVTAGDRVRHEIRFEDVTQVRVLVDGGLGSITPEFWNQAVALRGYDQDGKARWTKVSRTFVTTLQPLLHRISAEVERRPELIRDDEERELLQEYLAGAPGA